VAGQNTPALLMIRVGVGVMPGRGISAFLSAVSKISTKSVEEHY